jgi:hypothetical protein
VREKEEIRRERIERSHSPPRGAVECSGGGPHLAHVRHRVHGPHTRHRLPRPRAAQARAPAMSKPARQLLILSIAAEDAQ